MAFVFAKAVDAQLAGLAAKLDEVTGAHEGSAAVINLVGVEREEAAAFAADNELKHVAITICDERNAARFAVNPEAGVTVMHYARKKVASNFAAAPGELDEAVVRRIIAAAEALFSGDP